MDLCVRRSETNHNVCTADEGEGTQRTGKRKLQKQKPGSGSSGSIVSGVGVSSVIVVLWQDPTFGLIPVYKLPMLQVQPHIQPNAGIKIALARCGTLPFHGNGAVAASGRSLSFNPTGVRGMEGGKARCGSEDLRSTAARSTAQSIGIMERARRFPQLAWIVMATRWYVLELAFAGG